MAGACETSKARFESGQSPHEANAPKVYIRNNHPNRYVGSNPTNDREVVMAELAYAIVPKGVNFQIFVASILSISMDERNIPTLKDIANGPPLKCPICERPNYFPSDHHMVPKSRGGKTTETICEDCHKAIHAHFTNKELEETYHTPEALLSNEAFAKQVAFFQKQDPSRRTKTKKSKDRLARDR